MAYPKKGKKIKKPNWNRRKRIKRVMPKGLILSKKRRPKFDSKWAFRFIKLWKKLR